MFGRVLTGLALCVVATSCRPRPPGSPGSPASARSWDPVPISFNVNDSYVVGCIHARVQRTATSASVTFEDVELRWRADPPESMALQVLLARQFLPDSVRSNWEVAISTLDPIPLRVGPEGRLGEAFIGSTHTLPVPAGPAADSYWPVVMVRNQRGGGNYAHASATLDGRVKRIARPPNSAEWHDYCGDGG